MQRSTSFGLGFTLVLIGLAVFYWIHSIDPGDNTVVAMLVGCVAIGPGATLVGRAFWPPSVND
jgi:hypothetical protein